MRGGCEGSRRDMCPGSDRKSNMEEMYEVLRFIEHGAHCRQSMDCVEGTILIYYLRDHPEMQKQMLFEWFRQIGTSLCQYRRCRKGQSYRYLNPYSVVVSEEERLLLLNLEAPENEFVMKKMQQGAVREHFVKPLFAMGAAGHQAADLFGFGKTIQFMLAYTSAAPALTRREEVRLSRIIDRCTGSRGKQYEEIEQAVRELPEVKKKVLAARSLRLAGAGAAALLAAGFGLYAAVHYWGGDTGEVHSVQSGGGQEDIQEEGSGEGVSPKSESAAPAYDTQVTEEQAEACAEEADSIMEALLLANTESSNQRAVLFGRELELKTLRCLAAVYEREEMAEEAAQAYGRLIEIEDRKERVETAAVKKMQLEAAGGKYAKAVLTGETALQKLGESEQVEQLTEEYRQRKEGDEYADE